MRVALIGPELEENLALRYLHAAIVATGHDADIFDFRRADQIDMLVERLIRYDPHVVGLSMVFTGRACEFVNLAAELRRASYMGHITAGGHFASFHATELLRDHRAFDSIIHGEGEEAIVDLLANLTNLSCVPGVSFRSGDDIKYTGPRANPDYLDTRHFPTRPERFHSYLGLPIANILSSRGCYGSCNFCSIKAWYRQNPGRKFRQRKVEYVAREMAELYRDRGVRIFNFHDDNFFMPSMVDNVERFSALADCLRDLDGQIAIQVKARPDSVSAELIDILKEIGLFRVFVGVESNAVAGLRTLGRGMTRQTNHDALRLLAERRIHSSFNLLMFDPEATIADLRDNIAFIRQWDEIPLNFGRVEVYSNTPLEQRLRAENRLLGNYFGYSYRIADVRCQQAFELYRRIFLPRNFHGAAMNFQAMKVDYYLHLLEHFHPGRVRPKLRRRAKQLIRRLNRDSAQILEDICDFVDSGQLCSESELAEKAQELSNHRQTVDAGLAPRAAALIAQIHGLAVQHPKAPAPKRLLPYAASAAMAAALVIGSSNCDRGAQVKDSDVSGTTATSTEEADIEKAEQVRSLSDEELQEIQNKIYSDYLVDLDWLVDLGHSELEVWLLLDDSGRVANFEIRVPEQFDDPNVRNNLSKQIWQWSFPAINQKGEGVVDLTLLRKIDDDWHMCEMMMEPLDDL